MKSRMDKLIDLLKEQNLVGVALNPGPTLTYLTGMSFHLMERPTVLLALEDGQVGLILPELEMGKLPKDLSRWQAFSYGDDPATWFAAFETAFQSLNLTNGDVGVEPTRLRFMELSYLQKAGSGIEFVDASQVFSHLRMNKDSEEIKKMKEAARIAQTALLRTLKGVREGTTEKEIANELLIQLLKGGSDPEIPFAPIVAMGENSANPHAVPTERALRPGDLLLIDWGASYEGYLSDITRTFTFGEVDPELIRIGEIVLEANRAARKIGKAGLAAGAVDRAARSVITSAGYGHAFFHRTGHGLGMEAHEEPYIYSENDLILSPGAAFTIEPGIYLPGKGGVRIEDDVIVTEEGLLSLTDLPRQVLPLETLID